MKILRRILFLLFIMGCFLLSKEANAAYIYTLDVNIPNYDMITDKAKRIGGVEFVATGGDITSWEFGDAIPSSGNWIFESYGSGYYAIYDDYAVPMDLDAIAPMQSGRVVTLYADAPLNFSDIVLYDYNGADIQQGYCSHSGFNLVPIPPSALLLLSGLVGVVGFTRRKK